MLTYVTFYNPVPFVDSPSAEGILGVDGARWFAAILRSVPGLQIDEDLCQEDWGVVIFAQRHGKKFWIGLSSWSADNAWIAHIHHGHFAWLQRLTTSGHSEMLRLVQDIHTALAGDPATSSITWHEYSETLRRDPRGFSHPSEQQFDEK